MEIPPNADIHNCIQIERALRRLQQLGVSVETV
jgi:hypothetical protein